MSKKLEKNGLWESSRMMLPQHREALQNQRSDKPAPAKRPTAEDIGVMRDYVLLPLMHGMIKKKASEIEDPPKCSECFMPESLMRLLRIYKLT